ITELKYSAETPSESLLEAAMTQIRDRRYYERYLGVADKPILLLALAYCGAEKTMVCRMEEIRN
ncbi:MAG: hypothetical protein LBR06_02675, partial [Bacteroidales bacterium]|nr:hypothetical protein [Bacteroidales bacterium]